jgi:hypothetical protein
MSRPDQVFDLLQSLGHEEVKSHPNDDEQGDAVKELAPEVEWAVVVVH